MHENTCGHKIQKIHLWFLTHTFVLVDSLNLPLDCVHVFYLEKWIGSFKSSFDF